MASIWDLLLGRKLQQHDAAIANLETRLYLLERYTVAADQEMLSRLAVASSNIAARVQRLVEKVTALEGEIADEVVRDAAALQPLVEQLERMGQDAENPVPDTNGGVSPTNPEPDVEPNGTVTPAPMPDEENPNQGTPDPNQV